MFIDIFHLIPQLSRPISWDLSLTIHSFVSDLCLTSELQPSTGTATVSPDSSYRIPRLPPGEARRRQIAVAARLLREDNRRRTRPAIARGRKKCRVCNLTLTLRATGAA